MSEKEHIENFDHTLLTKYLNNETTREEKLTVELWLNQSVENRNKMEEYLNMLSKIDNHYKAKSFDSSAAWKNVQLRTDSSQLPVWHKKQRKEKIAQFYKYAAILVVALLIGSVVYFVGFGSKMPQGVNIVTSAEKQVLTDYVLPDSTVVTLNSNSTIRFPKQFAQNVRSVTIVGEAFFKVKPNAKKPFVIHAGGTQVKVLGTSFNVRAYPGAETVEVVVKTGKVEVTGKNSKIADTANAIFLVKGDKGTFYNETKSLVKSVNTNINFLAWKTNDIVFNETPLNEVVKCLEKVYHIEIRLNDAEIEKLPLTAHFNKKPIGFILNVIRLTFNLELTGENEHFELSGRKNKEALKS